MPDDYVLLKLDIPATPIEEVPKLPSNPTDVGDEWLETKRSALLRVPSFIVPESFNIILNPAHSAAKSISIASMRDFQFDNRLWLGKQG